MRLFFIGDIVGKPGRAIVCRALPGLIVAEGIDCVIANAENAAAGSGYNPAIHRELTAAGVDGVTLGDHVYRRREVLPLLESESNIVRPANLPDEATGRRWAVVKARSGESVGFFCLLGRLFMNTHAADNPWRHADRTLTELPSDVSIRLLDFHAEATGEAQTMGRYLDGRCSAVLGTHTHVPTADERILPGGTAFQCDVGMTGPHESILGRRIDRVLQATLTGVPTPFDVASDDNRINGALVEIDPVSGAATSIRRLMIDHARAEQLAGQ